MLQQTSPIKYKNVLTITPKCERENVATTLRQRRENVLWLWWSRPPSSSWRRNAGTSAPPGPRCFSVPSLSRAPPAPRAHLSARPVRTGAPNLAYERCPGLPRLRMQTDRTPNGCYEYFGADGEQLLMNMSGPNDSFHPSAGYWVLTRVWGGGGGRWSRPVEPCRHTLDIPQGQQTNGPLLIHAAWLESICTHSSAEQHAGYWLRGFRTRPMTLFTSAALPRNARNLCPLEVVCKWVPESHHNISHRCVCTALVVIIHFLYVSYLIWSSFSG